MQPAAEVEEIDLRACGRACCEVRASVLPAGQRVDQARLADIGTAGEGDLRQGRWRQASIAPRPRRSRIPGRTAAGRFDRRLRPSASGRMIWPVIAVLLGRAAVAPLTTSAAAVSRGGAVGSWPASDLDAHGGA